MIVVTTFPDGAWEFYAHKFLDTYVKYWQYPIHVYIDEKPQFDHPLVYWHEGFSQHPDVAAFLKDAPKLTDDYRYNSRNWVYKVIAQCEAVKIDKKVIWLDADIVTFDTPDHDWLERTCQQWPITYLGRRMGHSETGFVMFNGTYPIMDDFFKNYREMFTKKRIYGLKGWTDCHALDECMAGIQSLNLSPKGKKAQHVWPYTKLGDWMDHLKGQRKFVGHSPERMIL